MTKDEIEKKISEYCDINYRKISKSDVNRVVNDLKDKLTEYDGNYYNPTVATCQLKDKEKWCEDCGKDYTGLRIVSINLKTKHRRCNICKIGDE